MILRILILSLLLLPVVSYGEAVKLGPSFPCAKAATEIEKQICNNSALAEADLFLADLYKLGLSQSPASKPALIAEQKRWLTEMRNDLCLAEDFSWSKQPVDSFEGSDPLLKCYQIRIAELRSKVVMDESFINKWMELMLRTHGDNLNYVGGPTYTENISQAAQNYFNDKTYNIRIRYYGHECEGERYYLYYADDKFMRLATAKPNCEEYLPPETFTHLCLDGKRFVPVNGYWACHQKMTTVAALNEMQLKISQGILSKILRGDGRDITDPESFIWGLTRVPALVYNDPRFYTPEAISWALEHKTLFAPTIKKYRNILKVIFRQLLIEHDWILSQPGWQQKLASMTGSPLGNSEKIPSSAEMRDWTSYRLSNTQYTLHDFYVQVWARLYQNGGMNKAVEAIKLLEAELEAQ
ncbi:MAG TPA: hypothetical protein VN030_10100 [Cellvibrio sp.]|nr:hypothetical protein [Cellvibrio sp.]